MSYEIKIAVIPALCMVCDAMCCVVLLPQPHGVTIVTASVLSRLFPRDHFYMRLKLGKESHLIG